MSKQMDWQPISTAPKDGTTILGFWSYYYEGDKLPTIGMRTVHWQEETWGAGWTDGDGMTREGVYTHWIPLPPPPQ